MIKSKFTEQMPINVLQTLANNIKSIDNVVIDNLIRC
jgi:hypothetical protein